MLPRTPSRCLAPLLQPHDAFPNVSPYDSPYDSPHDAFPNAQRPPVTGEPDATAAASTARQQVALLAALPAFAPAVVAHVAALLGVAPPPAVSDPLARLSAADPMPRALWSSPSLAELPRWSGSAPATIPHDSADDSAADAATVAALVIPFHSGELAKIRYFISLWPTPPPPPSSAESSAESSAGTPIVFAMNADFASPAGVLAEQSIRAVISISGATNPVYFLSLRQPGATNHYDGAAMSFYQLQHFLGVRHFPAQFPPF